MKGKKLTDEVYKSVCSNWPIHITGICRDLGIEENPSNISKIRYHIRILKENEKVYTKKLDRALVAWPVDIEKLRVMRQFMSDV